MTIYACTCLDPYVWGHRFECPLGGSWQCRPPWWDERECGFFLEWLNAPLELENEGSARG